MAHRHIILGTVTALGLVSASAGSAAPSSTGSGDTLLLAADLMDKASRTMAIGISSLANMKVPGFDIDIAWSRFEDGVPEPSADAEAQFVVLKLDDIDSAFFDENADLKAIFKYWPKPGTADGAAPQDGEGGYLLAVDSALKPGFAGELIEAAMADDMILEAAGIDGDRLDPKIATADLPLPLHEGVSTYLTSSGVIAPAPVKTAEVRPALPDTDQRRSFTIYFDTDEAKLGRDDFKSVADACAFAATLPKARFVISGHADTVGTKPYNEQLSRSRATNVADAIRNDPRFREALSVVEFGEDRLAVATDDGIPEPMNRRVEITVLTE